MPIDLNVGITTLELSDSFIEMAGKLGLTGLAVPLKLEHPIEEKQLGITLYRRTDLTGNSISAIRKQLKQVRNQSMIVALPIKGIEISNWAAEDARVDVLTFDYTSNNHTLRESTARLAVASETALEIPVSPLLKTQGLERSRIVKPLRETCKIAANAGMKVVLSSGATDPIEMRSPTALQYIGLLLGMDTQYWKQAVFETPNQIIERNKKKLDPHHIADGFEIIRGDT